MGIITRTTCRICNSKNLVSILSLGNLFVSSFVDSPNEKGYKAPLELILCDINKGGCGLLQLKHTIPGTILYRNYWYKSGINESMIRALQDIAEKAEKLMKLSSGDVILDIGCNDGTLLRAYKTPGIKLVGFEPASNMVEEARIGTTKIINDFFNYDLFEEYFGNTKAKIITTIAMFYDLEDPNSFVTDLAKCLDKDGVWINQMAYLPSMLEQNAFDNIIHEHLEYYSLLALENLLKRHNLEVFDIELNDVNGGSFRIYIKHKDNKGVRPFDGAEKRVNDLREFEKKIGLNGEKVYDDFAKIVENIKLKVRNTIEQAVNGGKTVYVYGASTKGNTTLQYFSLDNKLIKAAAERDPTKWGKFTIGTWIPIKSEEEVRKEKPDYMLVLPWHFLDSFLKREKEYLESGGKFIVPMPKFKIIPES